MNKNIIATIAAVLIALVSLFVTLGIGIKIGRSSVEQPEPIIIRDTIRTTDTVRLPAPPPEVITQVKIKEVKVPASDVEIDTDVDSARVALPFEQHFTRLDDVADLWYSGYDAKIDSAIIYKHQQTVIEQHYITQPAKPNIIAVEAGVKDASVMYMRQLGSFYIGISAGTTYEGTATAKGIVGFRF